MRLKVIAPVAVGAFYAIAATVIFVGRAAGGVQTARWRQLSRPRLWTVPSARRPAVAAETTAPATGWAWRIRPQPIARSLATTIASFRPLTAKKGNATSRTAPAAKSGTSSPESAANRTLIAQRRAWTSKRSRTPAASLSREYAECVDKQKRNEVGAVSDLMDLSQKSTRRASPSGAGRLTISKLLSSQPHPPLSTGAT